MYSAQGVLIIGCKLNDVCMEQEEARSTSAYLSFLTGRTRLAILAVSPIVSSESIEENRISN